MKMKTSFCIFLFYAASLTQRYSCIHLIDLPYKIDLKSNLNHSLKKLLPSHPRPHSIYRPNKPDDIPKHHFRKNRGIPSKPPEIHHSEIHHHSFNSPVKRIQSSHEKESSLHYLIWPYPPIRSTTPLFEIRRYLLRNQKVAKVRVSEYEDEKDANLKTKISTLVQQTLHDTERKIKSIQHIKDKNRDEAPYKAGFILSMIKKSRDVLNELFNVAVKHKDEWKALEQLKIFELIVHTNVDTTNLVRQLVEIHIQHLNATNPDHEHQKNSKRRVVLL